MRPVAPNFVTSAPGCRPPSLPTTPPAQPEITWSWQIQVNMAWYTASCHHLLQEGRLRFAMQKHLGLLVFQQCQRCCYAQVTTGQRCHHQNHLISHHPRRRDARQGETSTPQLRCTQSLDVGRNGTLVSPHGAGPSKADSSPLCPGMALPSHGCDHGGSLVPYA